MVLVLHGDAPFNNPSYQYGIARKIASENENVVAIGLLRPGYTDNEGNRSAGTRGNTTGDNYTREVMTSIHQLTQQLVDEYSPSKILLLGHSGGAPISVNLTAEYTGFYAGAILISCPCDLHAWRAHMKTLQPDTDIWNLEVESLSPIEEVGRMDDNTSLMIIHGDKDDIVPIKIASRYVDILEANDKQVTLIKLEDQGHEIAFRSAVFDAVKKLIE